MTTLYQPFYPLAAFAGLRAEAVVSGVFVLGTYARWQGTVHSATIDLACDCASLTASVRGTLYRDTNNDGAHAVADESPLVGVTVELVDSVTEQVIATTVTGADGRYSFATVPRGILEVFVDAADPVLRGQRLTVGVSGVNTDFADVVVARRTGYGAGIDTTSSTLAPDVSSGFVTRTCVQGQVVTTTKDDGCLTRRQIEGPVDGAVVHLVDADTMVELATSETYRDGTFTFTHESGLRAGDRVFVTLSLSDANLAGSTVGAVPEACDSFLSNAGMLTLDGDTVYTKDVTVVGLSSDDECQTGGVDVAVSVEAPTGQQSSESTSSSSS
jgi:hypothetical protein